MEIQEQDSAKLAYLAITAQSDGRKDLPVTLPEATNHRDETAEKTSAEAYQIRLARIAEAQKQIDAISDPDLKRKAQEVLDSAISSGGSIADAKKEIAGIEGQQIQQAVAEGLGKAAAFAAFIPAATLSGLVALSDVAKKEGAAMLKGGISTAVESLSPADHFSPAVFAGRQIAYEMTPIDRGAGLPGRSLPGASA